MGYLRHRLRHRGGCRSLGGFLEPRSRYLVRSSVKGLTELDGVPPGVGHLDLNDLAVDSNDFAQHFLAATLPMPEAGHVDQADCSAYLDGLPVSPNNGLPQVCLGWSYLDDLGRISYTHLPRTLGVTYPHRDTVALAGDELSNLGSVGRR